MKLKTTPAENLHEALDAQGRPLCLLPLEEIQRQGLVHRSTAILAMDNRGKSLLSLSPEGAHGFSFHSPPPWGWSVWDWAEKASLELWQSAKLSLIAELPPCTESGQAFLSILKARISSAMADMLARDLGRWALLDHVEAEALMAYGCAFDPLLRRVLRELAPKRG